MWSGLVMLLVIKEQLSNIIYKYYAYEYLRFTAFIILVIIFPNKKKYLGSGNYILIILYFIEFI